MNVGDKIETETQAAELPEGTVLIRDNGKTYTKCDPNTGFWSKDGGHNYDPKYNWSFISDASTQSVYRMANLSVVGTTIVYLPAPPPKKVGDTVYCSDIRDLPFGTLLTHHSGSLYVVVDDGRIIGRGCRESFPSVGSAAWIIVHIPA